jgi:medium-chain acyl-[acyl-carrier-protein] hydrolase
MPPWFLSPKPAPQAPIRLFCFPYAGGGIPAFRSWSERLPEVEIWVANLPGRGSRFAEKPLTSMFALVQILAGQPPLNDSRPFAFFGHSMGARIAFELARALRRQRQTLPACLLLSACPAPQLPPRAPVHALPQKAFLAELKRRNGIPAAVLAEPELLDLLLPMVRADLTLYETAVYEEEPPLDCPITTFGGREDPIVPSPALSAWSAQTTGPFQQILLPGDHFFLRTAEGPLLHAIRTALSS